MALFVNFLKRYNLPVHCRSSGSTNGGDAFCHYEFLNVHLQQFKHHLHHGSVETHAPSCAWTRAVNCWKVLSVWLQMSNGSLVASLSLSWILPSTLLLLKLRQHFTYAHSKNRLVSRIFIVFLCAVSILWIPLVRSSQGGQLFNYIQAVQGYLGTPIGALFFLAVMWKRMTEHVHYRSLLEILSSAEEAKLHSIYTSLFWRKIFQDPCFQLLIHPMQ